MQLFIFQRGQMLDIVNTVQFGNSLHGKTFLWMICLQSWLQYLYHLNISQVTCKLNSPRVLVVPLHNFTNSTWFIRKKENDMVLWQQKNTWRSLQFQLICNTCKCGTGILSIFDTVLWYWPIFFTVLWFSARDTLQCPPQHEKSSVMISHTGNYSLFHPPGRRLNLGYLWD